MKHVCVHGQQATNTDEVKRLGKPTASRWFIRVCEQTCECQNNNKRTRLSHCTSCVCLWLLCFGKIQNVPGFSFCFSSTLTSLSEISSRLSVRLWTCRSFSAKKQEADTWEVVDESRKLDVTVSTCIKNGEHLHIRSKKTDFPAFASCFYTVFSELHSASVHATLQYESPDVWKD